ncbi:MAG: gluconate 2-dehydrogenase subunit 3 family protein [Dehalococcoidia bacterium]
MPDRHAVSRRSFLRSGAEIIALTAVAPVVASCTDLDEDCPEITVPNQTFAYAEVVPPPPRTLPTGGFLTADERRTVEAFTAQLLPGTPDDPGAREANVTRFIDVKLTTVVGFWEPTYIEPPFAEVVEGDRPSSGGENEIVVASDQADRYGFQSRLTPREIYRDGIRALNELARQRFGSPFPDLGDADQQTIVGAIADDEAPTFSEPSADLFFSTIRQDTVYGMFADPAYGGNVDMVGWRLIGYPGAQRAYTAEDLVAEAAPRPPQSLDELHHFNSGVAVNCDVLLPVSDADPNNQVIPGRHRP